MKPIKLGFSIFIFEVTFVDLDPSDGDLDIGLKLSCGCVSIGATVNICWKA